MGFMSSHRFIFFLLLMPAALFAAKPTGQSVVFLHPDGAGLSSWNLFRIWQYGPDGNSYWDELPGIAVYRAHMKDHLNASSHGGGTIHAYGVKVLRDSYGMDGKEPLKSASGYEGSLMMEAQAAGMLTGIINSGQLAEPGTATQLASVTSRKLSAEIAEQLIASNTPLIMGGGEALFLPEDVVGVYGSPGLRKDGRNLIEEAENAGYTIIYTKEQLEALSPDTKKVLGVFAAWDTYNDENEETLADSGLLPYREEAPTVAQMTQAAITWMQAQGKPYFLMVEEEGTDNFTNALNAYGMLEAMRRADESIGVTRQFVDKDPKLSVIVCSDSEASGPELIDYGMNVAGNPAQGVPLPPRLITGALLDGSRGTGTKPFVSAPDQFGQEHLFGIAWTDGSDKFGGVLVRGAGPIVEHMPVNMDNTAIFAAIRATILED